VFLPSTSVTSFKNFNQYSFLLTKFLFSTFVTTMLFFMIVTLLLYVSSISPCLPFPSIFVLPFSFNYFSVCFFINYFTFNIFLILSLPSSISRPVYSFCAANLVTCHTINLFLSVQFCVQVCWYDSLIVTNVKYFTI
jgi:hypothetical protein